MAGNVPVTRLSATVPASRPWPPSGTTTPSFDVPSSSFAIRVFINISANRLIGCVIISSIDSIRLFKKLSAPRSWN